MHSVLLVGDDLVAYSSMSVLAKIFSRGGLKVEDFHLFNIPPIPTSETERQLTDQITTLAPKCIVAMSFTAMLWLVPDCSVNILNARGYVQWSEKYKTWVICTISPFFISRGKTSFAQVLLHDVQRAVEVARDGFAYAEVDYTLDCTPSIASKWVNDFESYLSAHPDLYLSCDIETPFKKDVDEEELDPEGNGPTDVSILRCSYSYKDHHGMSLPWDGPFRPIHERLLGMKCTHLWWNAPFDVPHILADGITIGGSNEDGMLAWHILNSDLKKSLGFVAPFFAHGYPMWKHTSKEQPAFYNCQDAVVAGINMRGTVDLLKKHGLWQVYKEYICDLGPVWAAMTRAGMPIDFEKRKASSIALMEKLRVVQERIESVVPDDIRVRSPRAGYVRPPKSVTGLSEFVFGGITNIYCPTCNLKAPKKSHFKSKVVKSCEVCGVKWTKAHVKPKKVEHVCDNAGWVEVETNKCAGQEPLSIVEGEKRWARIEPFTLSPKGILAYQSFKKIPAIMTGRGPARKPTTDEKAIKTQMGKYPTDPFFPLVLDDREYSKVGGSYIGYWAEALQRIEGGFPVGSDGRVRGTFTDNPSTLRTSMVNPSLQTLPRGDDSEVQKWVKQMFVAPEGFLFAEADFSGIEAVLVGYHAGSREFMRLAKIDVHSYYTAYNLHRQGILPFADLPQLSWSDADLKAYGKEVIKKRFEAERNIGKRCIHAADYKASAGKLLLEYPLWFKNVKEAQASINIVYDLFQEIPKWHSRICRQVDKSAIIRNSFGHVHRFYQVLKWTKKGTEWDWDYGDDACRTIAFAPQSDAAFIGRAALKRMFYNYPDTLAQWLRLFVHDSVITECLKKDVDTARQLMHYEMAKPIVEMPLSPSWGLGEFVTIDVESKQGPAWSDMH